MTIIEDRFYNAAINYFVSETRDNKTIDWEQRRYEIAKDMMQVICSNCSFITVEENKEDKAKAAVSMADALIKALKE